MINFYSLVCVNPLERSRNMIIVRLPIKSYKNKSQALNIVEKPIFTYLPTRYVCFLLKNQKKFTMVTSATLDTIV